MHKSGFFLSVALVLASASVGAYASKEGEILRVSFELRAGGYDGSTYELTYDPATDRLKGTYYQAVVKQKFDVFSHGNDR